MLSFSFHDNRTHSNEELGGENITKGSGRSYSYLSILGLTWLAVAHLVALIFKQPLVDGERRLLVPASKRHVAALADEPRDDAVEQRALVERQGGGGRNSW